MDIPSDNMPLSENWFIRELPAQWKFYITSFSTTATLEINKMLPAFTTLLSQYKGYGQLVDASKLASWLHPFYAAYQAFQSYLNHSMIANNLSVEILLHIAGERQINRAINHIGITESTSDIALILLLPLDQQSQNINILTKVIDLFQGSLDLSLLQLTVEKAENLHRIYNIPESQFYEPPDWNTKSSRQKLIRAIINRGALLELEKVVDQN